MSESNQIFVTDHLGNAGHRTLADGVTVDAFKSGSYNGSDVTIMVNSVAADGDQLLVNGDRVSVSATSNKGA